MDQDLKLVLDAWRKLVVENDQLRQDLDDVLAQEQPQVRYQLSPTDKKEKDE